MIIGVDRLDYIKGVPNKLMAFDLFLSKHPEFQKQVTLVQVAVPTRTDVDEYQNLKTTVDGLVGLVNGKYGKFQVVRHVIDLFSHRIRRLYTHTLHLPLC